MSARNTLSTSLVFPLLLIGACGPLIVIGDDDSGDGGGTGDTSEMSQGSSSGPGQSETGVEPDSSGGQSTGADPDTSSSSDSTSGGLVCEGVVPYGDGPCMSCMTETVDMSPACCEAAQACADDCRQAIACLETNPSGTKGCLGALLPALEVAMCLVNDRLSAIDYCSEVCPSE